MTEEVNREPGPKGARIPMVMVINARNSLTPPEETALREWLATGLFCQTCHAGRRHTWPVQCCRNLPRRRRPSHPPSMGKSRLPAGGRKCAKPTCADLTAQSQGCDTKSHTRLVAAPLTPSSGLWLLTPPPPNPLTLTPTSLTNLLLK